MEIYRGFAYSTAAGVHMTTDDLAHPVDVGLLNSIGTLKSTRDCRLYGIRSNKALSEPRKAGELYVCMPNTQGTITEVATGDMACYDDKQNLHLLGRKSSLVETPAGPTLSLKFEEMLASFPLVLDAAVELKEERLLAYVVLADTASNYSEYALKSIESYIARQNQASSHSFKFDQVKIVRAIPRSCFGIIHWEELH